MNPGSFSPQFLQQMLSTMQASQNQHRFPVEYENSMRNQEKIDENLIPEIHRRACAIFMTSTENYPLSNLRTDLIVERAVGEINSQLEKEKLILTNGCCTIETCPTTKFIGCVLKAVESLKMN